MAEWETWTTAYVFFFFKTNFFYCNTETMHPRLLALLTMRLLSTIVLAISNVYILYNNIGLG